MFKCTLNRLPYAVFEPVSGGSQPLLLTTTLYICIYNFSMESKRKNMYNRNNNAGAAIWKLQHGSWNNETV